MPVPSGATIHTWNAANHILKLLNPVTNKNTEWYYDLIILSTNCTLMQWVSCKAANIDARWCTIWFGCRLESKSQNRTTSTPISRLPFMCVWVWLKQFWKEYHSWAHPSRTYIILKVFHVFFFFNVDVLLNCRGRHWCNRNIWFFVPGRFGAAPGIHPPGTTNDVTVTRVSWSLGLLIFWFLSYLSDLS